MISASEGIVPVPTFVDGKTRAPIWLVMQQWRHADRRREERAVISAFHPPWSHHWGQWTTSWSILVVKIKNSCYIILIILLQYKLNFYTNNDIFPNLFWSSMMWLNSSSGKSTPAAWYCCIISACYLPSAVSVKSILEHFNLYNVPSSAVYSSVGASTSFNALSCFVIFPEYWLCQQSSVSNSTAMIVLKLSSWGFILCDDIGIFSNFHCLSCFFFAFSNTSISFSISALWAAINRSSVLGNRQAWRSPFQAHL